MKEQKGFYQLGFLAVAALLFLFSCSDAREQYDRSNNVDPFLDDSNNDSFVANSSELKDADKVEVASNLNPLIIADKNQVEAYLKSLGIVGTGNVETEGGEQFSGLLSTFEEDERVRLNSVKPVEYETGSIAGITMKTTFSQSKAILSTPTVFQTDSGPIYVYKEGLYIYWRENEPRLPMLIWGTNDYRGELDTKDPELKTIYIGKSIAEHFGPEEELGRSYLRRLYNAIHSKPADFNCFETKKKDCDIRYFAESRTILFMMPKLVIAVAVDETKQIADMRIVRDDTTGNQDTPFDLIKGMFQGEEGSIALGQTYGEFLNFHDGRTTDFIDPYANSMSLRYGDAYTSTTKKDHRRDYIVPDLDETLRTFAVVGNFEQPIVLDGQQINIALDKEAKTLTVERGGEPAEGSRFSQMTLKVGLDKNQGLKDLQIQMMDDMRALISSSLINERGVVGYQTSGRFFVQDSDYLRDYVLVYDQATNQGKSIYFSMDRIQGNFNVLQTSLLDSPLNKLLDNAFFNEISVEKGVPLQNVGQFRLGDSIELDSIDYGKEEVTVKIDGLIERVSFSEDVIFKTIPSLTAGEFLEVNTDMVSPTDFPLSFYLEGNTIKAIRFSTSHDKPLNLTCGDTSTQVFFGSQDRVVEQELLALSGKCQVTREFSTNGSNLLSKIYLPEMNLILNFDNNDFVSVTTYKN